MSHDNIESSVCIQSRHSETEPFILLSALLPGILAAFALYMNRSEGHLLFRATGFPIWVLGIFSTILIPLFILEWSRQGLADIRLTDPEGNPLKRSDSFRIYLASFVRLVWTLLLILILVWFFSEVAGLFLSILGTGTGDEKILATFYAYLVALLPLMTLAAFMLLLLQAFKHHVPALVAGAFLYILLRSLTYLNNPIGKYNPALYMDWHLRWLDSSINMASLWREAAYLFVLFLVFFTAGYWLFARKIR
ncbi:MAG: hypothetical protein GXY34_06725 [Syntrophomonadaceae bacterium]|nr:hypothetical protein [Syntrophomonadaceae bacterium]